MSTPASRALAETSEKVAAISARLRRVRAAPAPTPKPAPKQPTPKPVPVYPKPVRREDYDAVLAMLGTVLRWIDANVEIDGDFPEWQAEAEHMLSYRVPSRHGARPIMRRRV